MTNIFKKHDYFLCSSFFTFNVHKHAAIFDLTTRTHILHKIYYPLDSIITTITRSVKENNGANFS